MIQPACERGQSMVISVLFLTALIGFAALLIDGGNWLNERRDMQGVADAATMAGVQLITESESAAASEATTYVTGHNAGDDAAVLGAVVTTQGWTSTCAGHHVPAYSVCVQTFIDQNGFFAPLFGQNSVRITAASVATASQVESVGGWLPYGMLDSAFASGDQFYLRAKDPGTQGGPINAPTPQNNCQPGGNGQAGINNLITGAVEACPITIGQPIETQGGAPNSIKNAFEDRLAGNYDSFEDCFELDPATGQYSIKLRADGTYSPRIALIPIAQDTGSGWPLSSGQNINVAGYMFAYIGDRSNSPTFPGTVGSGNSLRVALTPVEATLPPDWEGVVFGDYDPNDTSTVSFRMIQ